MADIITNQVTENLYFTGKAPLDSKLTPLSTIAELSTAIKGPQRYPGLEIIVLNSGPTNTNIPTRFILQNGISNKSWRVKDTLTVNTNAELEPFKPYLSEGTKITVLSDETNKGQLTEYISGTKKIVTDGVEETVVDFKKVNNDGVITSNELALKRLNHHEMGALIYLQDTIYSYTNEESITVYTDKLEEAQDKSDFTEIPTGFYIFQLVEGKEVLSQMIVNNTINSINIPIIGDDI